MQTENKAPVDVRFIPKLKSQKTQRCAFLAIGGNPFGGGSPFGQSVDAEDIFRSFFEGRGGSFGGFQTSTGGFSDYEQVQV